MTRKLVPAALFLSLLYVPACGGGGSDRSAPPASVVNADKSRLLGEVSDERGMPLEGADVSLQDGSGATARSDAAGVARLEIDPIGQTTLLVSKAGYTDQFVPVDAMRGEVSFKAQLRPRAMPVMLPDVESGGAVSGEDGVRVELDPAGVVHEDGSPVTGAIAVSMTPVDVSDSEELKTFPGRFAGRLEDGSEVDLIQTFGTAEILLSQNGESLQLATGAPATIELPIYVQTDTDGGPIELGDTIPFWYLDEERGDWQREGSGTVVASSESPTGLALRGQVAHFSWWNVDKVVDPAYLDPTVEFPPGVGPDGPYTFEGESEDPNGPRDRAQETVPEPRPLPFAPGVVVCFEVRVRGDNGKVYRAMKCVSGTAGETLVCPFILEEGPPEIVEFRLESLLGDQMTLFWRVIDADTIHLDPGSREVTSTVRITLPFAPGNYTLRASNTVGTSTETLTISEDDRRDTSAFNGRLSWTGLGLGGGSALRVWDLQASRYVALLEATLEDSVYSESKVSEDGRSVLYTRNNPFGLFSGDLGQIGLIDLPNATTTLSPIETGNDNEVRVARNASANATADTVAFDQRILTFDDMGLTVDETPRDIALWTPGGAVRVLETSPSQDDCPHLSADGGSVIFQSSRGGERALWFRSTAEGASAEPFGDRDLAEGLRLACYYDASADNRSAAYVSTDGERELILVTTRDATGDYTHRDIAPATDIETLAHFALSSDGSTLVFSTNETRQPDTPDVNIVTRLWRVDLPGGEPVLIGQGNFRDQNFLNVGSPLGISPDGQVIAAVFADSQLLLRLVVLRSDGSDVTTVTDVDESGELIFSPHFSLSR